MNPSLHSQRTELRARNLVLEVSGPTLLLQTRHTLPVACIARAVLRSDSRRPVAAIAAHGARERPRPSDLPCTTC
jgi:hypothetical protein